MTDPMSAVHLEEIRRRLMNPYLDAGRSAEVLLAEAERARAEVARLEGEVERLRKKDETARKVNEIAGKLKVAPDREGRLLVDATDVMHTGHDIQVWRLEPGDADGREWVCPEAGERGPLTQMLRAIAACYLLAPDGREQRR